MPSLLNRGFALYCDGSASNNGKPGAYAGWGYVIITRRDLYNHTQGVWHGSAYGPVNLNTFFGPYIGAKKATNQTAELTALYQALYFLEVNQGTYKSATVFTDSMYALNMTTRIWRPDDADSDMSNYELVLFCRSVWDQVKDFVTIEWVKGHAGCRFNEEADKLANLGRLNAKALMNT